MAHGLAVSNGDLTVHIPTGANPDSLSGGTVTATDSASASSAQSVTYAYDASGLRIRKTVDGAVTDYILHGKLLMGLKQGASEMHFFYDKDSRSAMVNFGGAVYTYAHNLQGDIVAILDSSGTKVVEYRYDAWGKPLGAPCTLITAYYETLARLNPFRYRGYVFDEETGLYYLRSRYYNPEWARFVSGDIEMGRSGKRLSHNLFAYCRNSPIHFCDTSGRAEVDIYDTDDINAMYIEAALALGRHPDRYMTMAEELFTNYPSRCERKK